MKLRIIPKLLASFLMLLLGSQAAKAAQGVQTVGEAMPKAFAPDTTPGTLDFGVQATPPQNQPAQASPDSSTNKSDSLPYPSPGGTATGYAHAPQTLTGTPTGNGNGYSLDTTTSRIANASRISTNQSKAIPSSSASELFATMKSPGSIAVGAAEGNLTVTGKTTSLYSGHTDPGNHVTNRGFCSWNRAANLSVAEADQRCLAALQRQAAATEQKLTTLGIDPKIHVEALVNGTDLWNQSNSAGPQFPPEYKKALDQRIQGKRAFLDARVEAFRNSAGNLDASGLFGICNREPYYRSKLQGYSPYSEAWRWNCIALDQGRRVGVVSEALKQNIRDTTPSPDAVQSALKSPQSEPESPSEVQPDSPKSDLALLFEPAVKPPTAAILVTNSPQQAVPQAAKVTDEKLLDFNVSSQNAAKSPQREPESSREVQPDSPTSNLSVLQFDANVEQVPISPAEQSNKGKVANPQAFTGKATGLGINSWTSTLKKKPNIGDKVAGYEVTSLYGKRIHPISGRSHFHGGVDVATPINTNLYAIGPTGTHTTLKCWTDTTGGGLVATMTSPSFPSLQFEALHLSWCKAPTNGSQIQVDAGEIIAGTGSTGYSTGPHLHFQMRDEKTGDRIPPSKSFISWVLTGKHSTPFPPEDYQVGKRE